jgi:hypothetical protein
VFESVVPFLKFRKMRFNRHVACLLAYLASDHPLHPNNHAQVYSGFVRTKIPAMHELTASVGGLVGAKPKRDNP